MPRQMSDKQYVAKGGTQCPLCRHDQVEGGELTVNDGFAWQQITCLGCAATWTDNYKLVSYELDSNPADEEKDEEGQ